MPPGLFIPTALAKLIEEENLILCVTHGNGPQVGMLALKDPETTLDVLGSESEGQIGYHIETELANQLPPEVRMRSKLLPYLIHVLVGYSGARFAALKAGRG